MFSSFFTGPVESLFCLLSISVFLEWREQNILVNGGAQVSFPVAATLRTQVNCRKNLSPWYNQRTLACSGDNGQATFLFLGHSCLCRVRGFGERVSETLSSSSSAFWFFPLGLSYGCAENVRSIDKTDGQV